jgi:hypothetical protein
MRIQWTNLSLERTTNTNNPTLLLPLCILHGLLNNITHKRSAQQNRRLVQIVMLITQRPHSSSFEDQTRVVRDILANPAACEGSQEVAVGDDQHVEGLVHAAFGLADGVLVEALADVGDDGVAAGGDVGGGSGRERVSLWWLSSAVARFLYSGVWVSDGKKKGT